MVMRNGCFGQQDNNETSERCSSFIIQDQQEKSSLTPCCSIPSNYSDLCAYVHVKKKWHCKGSHSSSVSGLNRHVRLSNLEKSDGLVHCSVENAAVLCKKKKPS